MKIVKKSRHYNFILFQTFKSDNCNLYELHQGVNGQSQVEADCSSKVRKKGAFANSIGLLKINFIKGDHRKQNFTFSIKTLSSKTI